MIWSRVFEVHVFGSLVREAAKLAPFAPLARDDRYPGLGMMGYPNRAKFNLHYHLVLNGKVNSKNQILFI